MKIKLFAMRVLLAFCGLSAITVVAANPGESVVVVYNRSVPESKKVAEHYAKVRNVPASQVLGLAMTSAETMSRAEFRDKLETPLREHLEKNKLWTFADDATGGRKLVAAQVDYAVLCYGVPLKIARDDSLKEEGADKVILPYRRNEAAVDNELAALPMSLGKRLLTGVIRSPYYGNTNLVEMHATNGVLMVARLDGPTVEIANGLVDKAVQAERDGLWGRTYIDLRDTKEPGYKPGDDMLTRAAMVSGKMGYDTIVENSAQTYPSNFPISSLAIYAGWYETDVSGAMADPKLEVMPGAFAYHLHSFSAAGIKDPNKHWVGPLLARGVTCTMGCVDEPYLLETPDMSVFFSSWMVARSTFGEAAYRSIPGLSWQTTVVGDPLYRPYGKLPQEWHDELTKRKSPLVAWSHLQAVNLNLGMGTPVAKAIEYLQTIPNTTNSAILSEKLGDLLNVSGKPSEAADAYLRAIKLDSTPHQRMRLYQNAANRLVAAAREADALEAWKAFAKEFPNHPDRANAYRQMATLAEKLGRKDEAEKYKRQMGTPK